MTPTDLVVALATEPASTLKQLLGAARHLANRERWLRYMRHRNGSLGRALKLCEQVLGARYAGRERVQGGRGWHLFGRTASGDRVLVAHVALQPLKTFDDFAKPPVVSVMRADLLDLEDLARSSEGPRTTR